MPTVTEFLKGARELRSTADLLSALDPEGSLYLRADLRSEANRLEERAEEGARWFFGSHRYPIDPEREAEWFANRYGLGASFDVERVEIDPDWHSFGKFDSQLCEIVWGWALEEAPFLSIEDDCSATRVGMGSLDLLSVFPLLCDEFGGMGWLPSAAIVWTDSRGFVSVDFFETIEEAEAEERAILDRAEIAADEGCESGDCEGCDNDPECEHSAHSTWCERADWLPSLDERKSHPAGGLLDELKQAESLLDSMSFEDEGGSER